MLKGARKSSQEAAQAPGTRRQSAFSLCKSAVLAVANIEQLTMSSTGEDIIRHSVPADHSCLFASVAYLCQGTSGEVELRTAGRKLREVCAQAVLADPDPASRAIMLGHDSVEAYVQWIRNETHWGGEPEVLMLAEHFETELVIVSCESLSLLRYAEGGKNGTAYLLYTGQHYDPLPQAATQGDAGAPCRAFEAAAAGVETRDKAAISLAQLHNLEAARRAK